MTEHKNPLAERYIHNLRNSHFYEDLFKEGGFSHLKQLSPHTRHIGADFLKNTYQYFGKDGIDEIVEWAVHPTSGFLPQTLRVKPLPEHLNEMLVDFIHVEKEISDSAFNQEQYERMIARPDPEHNHVADSLTYHMLPDAAKWHTPKPPLINAFTVLESASRILEAYALQEPQKARTATQRLQQQEATTTGSRSF